MALILALVGACAPLERPAGPPVTEPALASDVLVMADGARLPLRVWMPAATPRAVVLAIHGFNDYGHAFENPGLALAGAGVATYAYDQRGFGANPEPGLWPETAALAADARQAFQLIAGRHPDLPVYVLGESMGAAVVLVAFEGPDAPKPAGLILSAPALWGWSTLNPLYKATLWLASHVAPGWRFSGQGLDIQASDNIPMLQALAADPLFIKKTRADAIWGLVHAMDDALAAPLPTDVPVLMLYGANDQVIPPGPTRTFARRLGPGQRFAYYANGWHMLLRDLAANVVVADLLAWIDDPDAPLPSGADGAARAYLGGS